eukprot:scaffold5875_cov162-Skeletonema_dohrnii-CCMP3373.AAC.3
MPLLIRHGTGSKAKKGTEVRGLSSTYLLTLPGRIYYVTYDNATGRICHDSVPRGYFRVPI